MGAGKRAEHFRSCPVGTVLTESVSRMLSAYNYLESFREWPPGRRNPRMVDAFFIIKREHNLIDLEEVDKK